MGGKTKLLDLRLLETLYAESRSYEHRASAGVQVIQRELAKLNELAIRQAIAGKRDNDLKKAVSRADGAIAALKENFEQTKRFMEVKLAGAVNLSPIRRNASGPVHPASSSEAFPFDARLKK
ncbi:hypothetical protein ACF3MZ_07155 [Paenibacillaceae bacterium WGS1546]|uniref:hypothetical protein n=1 Tax=Cohnella sp. WGS1546 TaxID=3366810 RepID=UPI00372D7927